MDDLEMCLYDLESFQSMLMHKILQTHLLHVFVANLKIGGIYALYPESFCDKNLLLLMTTGSSFGYQIWQYFRTKMKLLGPILTA